MEEIPVPAASEHIVASKWRNWSTILSYVLSSNGVLRGIWWDSKSSTTLGPIIFDGGPENINLRQLLWLTTQCCMESLGTKSSSFR
jgi:hypothetical protein